MAKEEINEVWRSGFGYTDIVKRDGGESSLKLSVP
jgi:hypothetical protein